MAIEHVRIKAYNNPLNGRLIITLRRIIAIMQNKAIIPNKRRNCFVSSVNPEFVLSIFVAI